MDDETRQQLETLLDIETPLYYNSCTALSGLLNPGSVFSLCGRLQQTRMSVYQVLTTTLQVLTITLQVLNITLQVLTATLQVLTITLRVLTILH